MRGDLDVGCDARKQGRCIAGQAIERDAFGIWLARSGRLDAAKISAHLQLVGTERACVAIDDVVLRLIVPGIGSVGIPGDAKDVQVERPYRATDGSREYQRVIQRNGAAKAIHGSIRFGGELGIIQM